MHAAYASTLLISQTFSPWLIGLAPAIGPDAEAKLANYTEMEEVRRGHKGRSVVEAALDALHTMDAHVADHGSCPVGERWRHQGNAGRAGRWHYNWYRRRWHYNKYRRQAGRRRRQRQGLRAQWERGRCPISCACNVSSNGGPNGCRASRQRCPRRRDMNVRPPR